MTLIKRVFLFLAMNMAVLIVANIVLAIVQSVFWINVTAYGYNYTSIFIFALVFGFTGSFISLFLSKWMAKRSYGIQLFDQNNLSSLNDKEKLVYDVVRELSNKHGISIPEVWVFQAPDANAFATWATKNSSLVAVSTGLLEKMNRDEIEGVIAHEMAHILNGDMVTMSLLQWVLNTFVIFFARIIANLADAALKKEGDGPSWIYYVVSIVMEIVLWLLASIIAMWFSRYREYRADEGSARFVGKEKMIAALKSLQRMYESTPSDTESGKMAAFQISTKNKGGIMQLFSSHPALSQRIQNLEKI